MTVDPVQVSPAWLRLREEADARARSTELVDELRTHLRPDDVVVVHDLGCGTGSMGRWLAPRLSDAQRWVLYDWDADLLAHAAADMPGTAADGSPVAVETRRRDISRLRLDDLAGASLVTASALLDMLTREEIERLVRSCVDAGCPGLFTLTVTGRVELAPADPLDGHIVAAFNDHQRRTTGGRRLLGPDAVDALVAAFEGVGYDAVVRPSPWRLAADQAHHAALVAEWLSGWVGAAREQRPRLVTEAYLERRLSEAAEGALDVIVHHADVLVRPR